MIPDPQDTCCQILRCDVTLNEKDVPATEPTMFKLLSVLPINSSTIKLEVESVIDHLSVVNVVLSDDGKKTWQTIDVIPSQPGNQYFIKNLKSNTKYFIRQGSDNATIYEVVTSSDANESQNETDGCRHNGISYKMSKYKKLMLPKSAITC